MAPDEVVVGATDEGATLVAGALAVEGGGDALAKLVEALATVPGMHWE